MSSHHTSYMHVMFCWVFVLFGLRNRDVHGSMYSLTLLTVGLCGTRVLLVAADAVSSQAVVETSVGIELVLGKTCGGDGEP